jgi:hypothetical protein
MSKFYPRIYGRQQTEVQVDCEWATLDVTVHWVMETDGFYIDKITVGDKDLREGWNVDYFSAIVEEDIYSRAEGPHL